MLDTISSPPPLTAEEKQLLKSNGRYGLFEPQYDLGDPDAIEIERIHHFEVWAGNAMQSAYFYREAFGFQLTAYAGPETGVRDRASYVLEQGDVRIVLTTALGPDSPIARHHLLHGDGVAMIAYRVPDARRAFDALVRNGAASELEPTVYRDDFGEAVIAGIRAFGDTCYRLIEDRNYHGAFLPHYEPRSDKVRITPAGDLRVIDHIVTNVEDGRMEHWVDWYARVFGFKLLAHFDDKDISTDYSSLRSKVMTSRNGIVRAPVNEPASGLMKSQIQEYIDYYRTPGVQHIALSTDNIVATISRMKNAGVEFLYVPDTYYEDLISRVGRIDEDVETLANLGILVDRDDQGYLLQLFTKPVEDRPTLFFEIIQRKGAISFGKGNFRALFVSIEEEQRRRGNI
ncbi:MAG: 4-hydroxyphenylpyruvate dioxygenase [Calditrichaeota bacterium]|nr:4-hydroxyphenylpyruvate dioxygenase [Calditrichota bacterium]